MDKDLIYFRKIIENKGYKFTTQKQIILKLLIKSKIHLNAEEIYKNVREFSIGLATVYRTLKMFNELGIVKEISINGVNYYEMKIFSGKPLHIHLKCTKCGSIIDIDDKYLNLEYLKLNNLIEGKNNLTISDVNIMLVGLCSDCREDRKWQDQLNSEE